MTKHKELKHSELSQRLYGESNREKFIEEFDVKPLIHNALLNNNIKKSIVGRDIIKSYYIMQYTHKRDKNISGNFICGITIAEHLLKLTNQKKIPMLNPLKMDDFLEHAVNNKGKTTKQSSARKWHPLTKEAYTAIRIFSVYLDQPFKQTSFYEYLDTFLENPNEEPSLDKIKHLNNTFKNPLFISLQNMIQTLKEDNPKLRDFTFPNIEKLLQSKNIPSYF